MAELKRCKANRDNPKHNDKDNGSDSNMKFRSHLCRCQVASSVEKRSGNPPGSVDRHSDNASDCSKYGYSTAGSADNYNDPVADTFIEESDATATDIDDIEAVATEIEASKRQPPRTMTAKRQN